MFALIVRSISYKASYDFFTTWNKDINHINIRTASFCRVAKKIF